MRAGKAGKPVKPACGAPGPPASPHDSDDEDGDDDNDPSPPSGQGAAGRQSAAGAGTGACRMRQSVAAAEPHTGEEGAGAEVAVACEEEAGPSDLPGQPEASGEGAAGRQSKGAGRRSRQQCADAQEPGAGVAEARRDDPGAPVQPAGSGQDPVGIQPGRQQCADAEEPCTGGNDDGDSSDDKDGFPYLCPPGQPRASRQGAAGSQPGRHSGAGASERNTRQSGADAGKRPEQQGTGVEQPSAGEDEAGPSDPGAFGQPRAAGQDQGGAGRQPSASAGERTTAQSPGAADQHAGQNAGGDKQPCAAAAPAAAQDVNEEPVGCFAWLDPVLSFSIALYADPHCAYPCSPTQSHRIMLDDNC